MRLDQGSPLVSRWAGEVAILGLLRPGQLGGRAQPGGPTAPAQTARLLLQRARRLGVSCGRECLRGGVA